MVLQGADKDSLATAASSPVPGRGSAADARRMGGLMATKDGVWAGTDEGRMARMAGRCTVKPLRGGMLAGKEAS